MGDCKRCWAISFALHGLLVVFAACATVAIGVPESELDRVLMVTEFVPCEAFWLIEGRRGHEGTTDEPPSHEEGIQDADVSVPDIFDPSDQLIIDPEINTAHFEDGDTSLPQTSKCTCRISSCACEASRYASLICTCDGGAKK